jgi:dTDP-4-amino-4,6-dideoxygalactose transaminase
MHLQPVFAGLGYAAGDLPVAEEAARTALALPMHPNLTREDVAEVVAAVAGALEERPVAAPSGGQAG